jgi:hypothetical protein
MEPVELIDYSYPSIQAEKALHRMRLALLDKKYDEALELALKAIVETKMAYNAIRHEMEKSNG